MDRPYTTRNSRRRNNAPIPFRKALAREKLAADTARFLASGGKITLVERGICHPPGRDIFSGEDFVTADDLDF